MKNLARFALPLLLAAGCGGADKDATVTPEPVRSDTLSGAECDAMVAHMAEVDATVDRDAALADCTVNGDRRRHACVMAATDPGTLASCGGRSTATGDDGAARGATGGVVTPSTADDPGAPGPTGGAETGSTTEPALPPSGPSRPGAPTQPDDPTGPGIDPSRPTPPR